MRKFIVASLLMFFCFSLTLMAQDATTVTMSIAEYESMKSRVDSLNSVIRHMTSVADSLSLSLETRDSIISNLRNDLAQVNTQMSSGNSQMRALKDSIQAQQTEISRLNEEVASLDMVRLRYANGRLQLPYDDKKVREAIELFNSIKDESLKEQCQDVLVWLNQYGYYVRDVKSLIQTLQDDPRRNNKFQFDAWKAEALRNISNNSYQRDSKGHQFTIIYLDNILFAAKGRIERADSKSFVDFSDLLERF